MSLNGETVQCLLQESIVFLHFVVENRDQSSKLSIILEHNTTHKHSPMNEQSYNILSILNSKEYLTSHDFLHLHKKYYAGTKLVQHTTIIIIIIIIQTCILLWHINLLNAQLCHETICQKVWVQFFEMIALHNLCELQVQLSE